MAFRTLQKKLTFLRDSIRDNGHISAEDQETLRDLVKETISTGQTELKKLPKKFDMPVPNNDNQPLTTDQRFRLKLIEKTGTGSASIH